MGGAGGEFVKFLALKAALDAANASQPIYEKNTANKGCHVDGIRRQETRPYRLDGCGVGTFAPAQRARVEGGIDRKPVDATARRVIQPAPWWAKLERTSMGLSATNQRVTHPAQACGTIEGRKSEEQFNAQIAGEFVKKVDGALARSEELYTRTRDARQAIAVLVDEWQVAWLDFCDTTDKRLTELRLKRMALDSELGKLMQGFRDVRAFFLDKNYETEITRLREFVSLCERLQKLKESGFLDTVADTMLKLAK